MYSLNQILKDEALKEEMISTKSIINTVSVVGLSKFINPVISRMKNEKKTEKEEDFSHSDDSVNSTIKGQTKEGHIEDLINSSSKE